MVGGLRELEELVGLFFSFGKHSCDGGCYCHRCTISIINECPASMKKWVWAFLFYFYRPKLFTFTDMTIYIRHVTIGMCLVEIWQNHL